MHAWHRVVPEKWTCREAWLESSGGTRVFSRDDHPLHVMSYSLPFDGAVTRSELLEHLHVHSRLPQAIPHASRVEDRDWGLCCSKIQRDALVEDRYRVAIRSTFSYAALEVGEIVVPGRSANCALLAAYLGHPCQANVGLSGVAVALDVARALRRLEARRLTYRILIAPESIGLVAYLAANEALIPHVEAALVLGMLGGSQPHALAVPATGPSGVGNLRAAFAACGGEHVYESPELIGSDADDVAAVGARFPLAALVRTRPPGDTYFPYREHQSSEDTPPIVDPASLEQSLQMVLTMIDVMDAPSR
jgi:aminopeptidase-like protein